MTGCVITGFTTSTARPMRTHTTRTAASSSRTSDGWCRRSTRRWSGKGNWWICPTCSRTPSSGSIRSKISSFPAPITYSLTDFCLQILHYAEIVMLLRRSYRRSLLLLGREVLVQFPRYRLRSLRLRTEFHVVGQLRCAHVGLQTIWRVSEPTYDLTMYY